MAYSKSNSFLHVSSNKNSLAFIISMKLFLLQHLGPPISPIEEITWAVILFEKPHEYFVSGVAHLITDANIPLPTPAPQIEHWLYINSCE